MAAYVGAFVVGLLVAKAAGWGEFKTGAAFSLVADPLYIAGWRAAQRRRARAEDEPGI